MDKKQFAIIFVIVFILMTYYLYYNDVMIAQTIKDDGLKGMIFYFASNLAYVLIFVGILFFNKDKNMVSNILGAFMLIYAIDIISFPRFMSSGMSQDLGFLASSDGVFISRFMEMGFQYANLHLFYYLILPIALILGSVYILGTDNFIKKIIGGG